MEGTVEHSVLSPGVVVERGAIVRDSVIMHRCRIAEVAVVDRAILDKDVGGQRPTSATAMLFQTGCIPRRCPPATHQGLLIPGLRMGWSCTSIRTCGKRISPIGVRREAW
jgi:hypothetical protein